MIIETKIFLVFVAIIKTIIEGNSLRLIKGLKLRFSSQKIISEKTSAEKIVTGINDNHLVRTGELFLFFKKSIGMILGIKVANADPKIIIHLSIVIFTSNNFT